MRKLFATVAPIRIIIIIVIILTIIIIIATLNLCNNSVTIQVHEANIYSIIIIIVHNY